MNSINGELERMPEMIEKILEKVDDTVPPCAPPARKFRELDSEEIELLYKYYEAKGFREY